MKAADNDELTVIAAECGLDGARAVPCFPLPVDEARVRARLARDPPELAYLSRSLDRRLDPGRIFPGARSVVAVFVSYACGRPGVLACPPGHGFVSRFAWSVDYHETVGARVRRLAEILQNRYGCRARPYVDTGPVFEKAWAAAAGLGFLGRNTLLITPRFGSFVFLGAIVTDLACDPQPERPTGDCGACRACVEACPTGALDGDGNLDPSRCLAHLTVSSKSPIPLAFRAALSNNLYGCDLCQDVCPANRGSVRPGRPEFGPLPGLYCPDLAAVRALDAAGFSQWAGASPIRRRGLELVRHVAEILESRR